MFGQINKKEALGYGATHHGSYYGIPIWINPETSLAFPKNNMLEPLMLVFAWIECFIKTIIPNSDVNFQFTVKERIENE